MKILTAILGLFLFAGAAFSQSLEQVFVEEKFLASDGRFVGEIYVPSDIDIEELQAAEDLAEWIGRVCGTEKISIRLEESAPAENPRGIFFGNTRKAAREGISAPVSGVDSFAIVPRGNSIFFVAGTSEGLWHASARFMREVLGVEFVFPGKDGAEWTPKPSVLFPRERIQFAPAWTWRSVSLGPGNGNREWALHLGFGERPQFSHNLGRIFTEDVYQKFPDLRPTWRDGKTPRKSAQPNLSSENAVEVAASAAHNFFEKNPTAPMFSVGINDSVVWDESPESEKIYGVPMKWFRNLPDRSDYFWGFANRVADHVAETKNQHHKKISAIAYLDTQNTPSFKVSSSIVPVLCADRSMWVFPEFRAEDEELMRRWARSGAEYWGIYDYYYGMPYLSPRIFFESEAASLKFAYEHGARVFYAEISAIAPFDAPKIWLLSRLLENPAADPNEELSRFFKIAYGRSAMHMRDFFELCEKTWREQGGQCRWIKAWRNENATEIFPEKTLEELAGILKNARAQFLAEPEDDRDRRIVARLDKTQEHLSRAQAFAHSYFERKKLLEAKLDSAEEIVEVLQSPAWNFEKIYSDENFAEPEFSPNKMRISDPRATVFIRSIDALRKMPKSEARSRAEDLISQMLPSSRGRFPQVAELEPQRLVPAMSGAPILSKGFEPEVVRSPIDGEDEDISQFVYEPQTDWRAGKKLGAPKGWKNVLAPAENAISGETNLAHSGKKAFRIAGHSETTEIFRSVSTHSGEGLVFSAWARGKISVGAGAEIGITWRDQAGKAITTQLVCIPSGDQTTWRRFVVAGIAPERAKYATIFLEAWLFGVEDEVIFDDLEVFSY